MLAFLDNTLGKWIRHFLFLLVRTYYALFYNVSCAGKHLLQNGPGTLILATHVSRHDGPLIASILYTTTRVRPTVHWDEYHHWAQRLPLTLAAAIPMSSPKSWPEDKRRQRKIDTLAKIHGVLQGGYDILLFPAGRVRRQPEEIVAPYLSGVYDILRAAPDTPVMLLRTDGLGTFQPATYDWFWTFLGITKGRRHVSIDIRPIRLDPDLPLEDFNAHLQALLNTDIFAQHGLPLIAGKP